MKIVRIGVIGLGCIAGEHLREYAQIPGVEVVAAADVNPAALEGVCDQYGIRHRYLDFRELLKRDDLDAVDVCLHNHLHAPVSILALRAGKHVYCEKPIAGAYRDGKAMLDAAEECGRMLHVQLLRVFLPETACAKRLVDAGRLGKLFYARTAGYRRRGRPYVDGQYPANFVNKRHSGGGAVIDMSTYKLAQMLYLAGNPRPSRVSGRIFQEKAMDEELRQKSGYDVEELGMGFINFENGMLLDMVEAWAIDMDGLGGDFLVGSEGGVRLTPAFRYISTIEDMEAVTNVDLEEYERRRHGVDPLAYAYDSPQKHWVAALRGDAELIPSAQIALHCALIQEAVYLSAARGCEVDCREVAEQSASKAVRL